MMGEMRRGASCGRAGRVVREQNGAWVSVVAMLEHNPAGALLPRIRDRGSFVKDGG